MRILSEEEELALNKQSTPKINKPVQAPVSTPKPSSSIDAKMVQEQVKATLAIASATEKAVNNPKLDQILNLLLQQSTAIKDTSDNLNKRLIINRDSNGLIKSIDIKGIK